MMVGARGPGSKDDAGDVICRARAPESARVFAHGGYSLGIVEQAGKLMIEHGHFGTFDGGPRLEEHIGIAFLLSAYRIEDDHRQTACKRLCRGQASRFAQEQRSRPQ